ncbi:polysaccharide deacetylase family protein [Streptomyces sp. CA-111067]|uniref:polysaccharide deacetylase family protein n=1 Tax=Streptomyces sp. CA-111067 TaxID=3240046 RepID=UPI003D996A35
MRVKAVLPLLAVFGLLVTVGCTQATFFSRTPEQSALSGRMTVGHPFRMPQTGRAAAFHKWNIPLMPLAPLPPAVKPVKTGPGLLPYVARVPTSRKVVFLTFDDGLEKDPEFVTMMRELNIPFTMFLTDRFIKDDYGYFKPLQELGNPIENHTLTHPDLIHITDQEQQAEICGQQVKLTQEYGATPGLFRPPYGNMNAATVQIVKSCGGLRAVILWREAMDVTGVQFPVGEHAFQPGDIILAHFRTPSQIQGESMTAMTANLLREIAAQGFSVAALEDYV